MNDASFRTWLDRYGAAVLELLAGGDPHAIAEKTTAAIVSD